MIAIWLVYIIINCYAYYEGITHGILYSLKGANAFPGNEHAVFVSCRSTLVLTMFLSTRIETEAAIILTFCFLLSYSFIHNGAYYLTRNSIDKSLDFGWFSDSSSDTAKIKFGSLVRTITFVISVLILIIYTIYKS